MMTRLTSVPRASTTKTPLIATSTWSSPVAAYSVDLGKRQRATAVFAGPYHSCAILDGGAVKCWGFDEHGQLGIGGGFGPRDFIASFALEECQHAHSCRNQFPTNAPVTFEQAFGADVVMCEAMALEFYQPEVVRDSVNAGRIIYNRPQAEACIGALDFGTCAQYFGGTSPLPAACDQALIGQLADGQQCNHDLECASASSWCGETQVCEPVSQ